MDLRDHITALAATADRIGLGYSHDAARAVRHHVEQLRDALDEHALKVTAAIREAHAAKDAEIERLRESVSWLEAEGVVFALERDDARTQRNRLRDRMHGLAQQWRGGRAPGPEFGHALEAAVTEALDQPGDQEGTTP